MPAHRRPSNADELLRQARRLMSSPVYRQPDNPDYQKVHATVTKIYSQVYGNGPPHDPAIVGQAGEAR